MSTGATDVALACLSRYVKSRSWFACCACCCAAAAAACCAACCLDGAAFGSPSSRSSEPSVVTFTPFASASPRIIATSVSLGAPRPMRTVTRCDGMFVIVTFRLPASASALRTT